MNIYWGTKVTTTEISLIERINKELTTLTMEGFEPTCVILGTFEYQQLVGECMKFLERAPEKVVKIDTVLGYLKVVKKIRTHSTFEFGE